jgi:chitodextrinase
MLTKKKKLMVSDPRKVFFGAGSHTIDLDERLSSHHIRIPRRDPFIRKRTLRALALISILLSSLLTPALSSTSLVMAQTTGCATSGPASLAYSVTICFSAPSNGAALTGNTTVTGTVSVTGTNPGVQRFVFYLDGVYLLTDYQSVYTFILQTARWIDGNHTLTVEALMRDAFITTRATRSVSFQNGTTTPPVNNRHFQPSTGTTPASGAPFVVVAAGDGAGGESSGTAVAFLIESQSPNLVLYLGDVYEKGSSTEFYNWYGTSTTYWGRFKTITNPTIGNHEYSGSTAPGYFDYWDNIPNYYSYDAGGWHFVSLNSNASRIGVTASSAQYQWLAQDLAANSQECTIVYYHHPLFNIGPEGPTTAMTDIWKLLAQNKVSIVLNGHDHDYQRWMPLDGNGQINQTGITEFVAGGSGHGVQTILNSDSRVAFSSSTNPTTFGALRLELTGSGASFSYRNTAGATLDSGFIGCSKSFDTQAPSVPGNLQAVAGSTQVNLSWSASTDNTGVTGYTIYRNGSVVATVSGATLSYSDSGLQPSTSYSYTVDAFDAAGNHSAKSGSVSVTTTNSADTQAPSVPGNLQAVAASSSQVNLSWSASTDNTGVTGYTIYRNGSVVTTVSGAMLSYSDSGLQTGTSYSYTVDAFDAAGNHSAKTGSVGVTTPNVGSSLTFVANADTYVNAGSPTSSYGSQTTLRVDGSPDVHSYIRFTVQGLANRAVSGAHLMIYANSSLTLGINAVSVSNNTWVETSMTYNTAPALGNVLASSGRVATGTWVSLDVNSYITGEGTYTFGITTTSSTAMSMQSRESGANGPKLVLDLQNGTADTQAPTTPTGIGATITANPLAVNLTWAASSDNVGVTGYSVFRGGVSIATLSGTTLSYKDLNVTSGTTYSYTVNAFDAAGNQSAQSAAAVVSTNDTQAPTTPANFGVSLISATRVDLTWTASIDNIGVTGYTVYRNGSSIATVGGTTLVYSDTSVSAGATYSYTVDAFDQAGNHSPQTGQGTVTIPNTASSQTVLPAADSYVNAASPTSNYGSATTLRVDLSPIVNSYVRFIVLGLGGKTITRARLLVYATSPSNTGLTVQSVADNTWDEKTINYNNAPALGTSLGISPVFTTGTWVTIDVTSYVTAEGTFSFGISLANSTAVAFASRESGANSPQLVLDLQ